MALKPNAVVNKVVYGDQTLIDLTEDTVTPADLAVGARAHDASGKVIFGEASLLNELNEYEKILYLGVFSDNPTGNVPATGGVPGSIGTITSTYIALSNNLNTLTMRTTIENNNSIERRLLKKRTGTNLKRLIGKLKIIPMLQYTTFEGSMSMLNCATDYEITHYDETSGDPIEIVTFRRILTEYKSSVDSSATITKTIFNNYQRTTYDQPMS